MLEFKIPMPLGFVEASGTPWKLQSTFIREGIKPVIRYNDVIQDSNIQQDATLLDLSGDLFIRLAWLGVATGMVVPLM